MTGDFYLVEIEKNGYPFTQAGDLVYDAMKDRLADYADNLRTRAKEDL